MKAVQPERGEAASRGGAWRISDRLWWKLKDVISLSEDHSSVTGV